MKKIFKKIVAKSKIKPEITKVLVKENVLVATNSYLLLEVKRDCLKEQKDAINLQILRERFEEDILLTPEELDLEPKLLEVMPVDDKFSYPEYERIIPDEDTITKDYYSIKLNPKLLANIAQALADTYSKNQYQSIQFFVPKEGHLKPAIIKREDKKAVGVIMPLTK